MSRMFNAIASDNAMLEAIQLLEIHVNSRGGLTRTGSGSDN